MIRISVRALAGVVRVGGVVGVMGLLLPTTWAGVEGVYAERMGRIIEAADRRGMIVLVGCLYWSTSRAKEDLGHWTQADAERAVANTVRWLKEKDYRNVFVDVDN